MLLEFAAGNNNIAPPTGQVLTCNTTNDRGWNDPPSHAFSPTNVNRKRLDPRKRVGHNLTSGAGTAPAQSSPLPLNGTAQQTYINESANYPVAPSDAAVVGTDTTSNHDIHNPVSQIPITNIPHTLNRQEQPNVFHQPLYNNIPDMLPQSCVPLQPAFKQPSTSISPETSKSRAGQCGVPCRSLSPTNDKVQNGRKLSAPSSNLNTSSIFSKLTTPTMLQSSHIASKSSSAEVNYLTNTGFRSISPIIQISEPAHLSPIQCNTPIDNADTNENLSIYNNPLPQMSSLPPMSCLPPMTGITEETNLYTRTNSLPGLLQRKSPTNAIATAPPTTGFYSTKDGSQHNSGHNSPLPKRDKLIIENDSELLNEIVERLLDCRDKCACVITNKVSDDIKKKIQAFKTMWSAGKLSSNVKVEMSTLSLALDKREFGPADSIHKSLIVSHSSEVMSWMVGVKKLISSYQKVIEENNKY